MPRFLLSFGLIGLLVSNSVFACELLQAQAEAKKLLKIKYRNDNVFVGKPEVIAGSDEQDYEIPFAVVAKEPEVFAAGELGKVTVTESNHCLASGVANSSYLLDILKW